MYNFHNIYLFTASNNNDNEKNIYKKEIIHLVGQLRLKIRLFIWMYMLNKNQVYNNFLIFGYNILNSKVFIFSRWYIYNLREKNNRVNIIFVNTNRLCVKDYFILCYMSWTNLSKSTKAFHLVLYHASYLIGCRCCFVNVIFKYVRFDIL